MSPAAAFATTCARLGISPSASSTTDSHEGRPSLREDVLDDDFSGFVVEPACPCHGAPFLIPLSLAVLSQAIHEPLERRQALLELRAAVALRFDARQDLRREELAVGALDDGRRLLELALEPLG